MENISAKEFYENVKIGLKVNHKKVIDLSASLGIKKATLYDWFQKPLTHERKIRIEEAYRELTGKQVADWEMRKENQ